MQSLISSADVIAPDAGGSRPAAPQSLISSADVIAPDAGGSRPDAPQSLISSAHVIAHYARRCAAGRTHIRTAYPAIVDPVSPEYPSTVLY